MADATSRRHPGAFEAGMPAAIGLAIAFAIAQLVLFVGVTFVYRAASPIAPSFYVSETSLSIAFGAIFLWAHALFVLLVADAAHGERRQLKTTLIASAPLTILFALFAWLQAEGGSYSCGEGNAIDRSGIPMLPWLWIGWAVITLLAAPTRFVAWASTTSVRLVPIWKRALWMLPAIPAVWFFGVAFQPTTIALRRKRVGACSKAASSPFRLLDSSYLR